MDTPTPDPGPHPARSDNSTDNGSNLESPDNLPLHNPTEQDPLRPSPEEEGIQRVFVSEIDHVHYVGVAEAARLLGVHPNTIRYRLKTGRYQARKLLTVNGEAYLIPRAALEEPPAPPREDASPQPPPGPLDHAAQLLQLEGMLGRVAGELAERLTEPLRAELASSLHTIARLSGELGVEKHAHYTEKARREAVESELARARETKRGWLARLFGVGQ